MTENNRDHSRELAKARQDLADAQARLSTLEVDISPSEHSPSRSFLFAFFKRFDVRTSLGYGILATLWILFSDHLLAILMTENLQLSANFSLVKGLAFVWLTALALFSLLRKEIRKRNQTQEILHGDLIRRNQSTEKINNLNRTLALLSDINQAIVRTRDTQTLFDDACKIAVEKGKFRMAWIGILDPETQAANPVSQAGEVGNYLEAALKVGPVDYGPTAIALKTRNPVVMNDIEHDPIMQRLPWRDNAIRLGYRASVALPIIVKGESYGIYHLYSDKVDFFDDQELKLLGELAGDLAFAIEFAQQEAERQRVELQNKQLYRTLSVLSDVNQAIVRIRDISSLLVEVCKIAVEKGAFRMAWIGLLDAESRYISPVAHAGFVDDYLEKLNISLDDEGRGNGPTGKAIKLGQAIIANDIQNDPRMLPWRADALKLDYKASASLPLVIMGEARGALMLYAQEANFFDDAEMQLLEEMAGDLAFAMEYSEQEKLREQAEQALQGYAKRMEIFHEIDTGIINATSTEEIIEAALQHIRQLIPCQRVSVIFLDRETNEFLNYATDSTRSYSIKKGDRIPIFPDWDKGFGADSARIVDDLRTATPQLPVYKQLVDDGLVTVVQALLKVREGVIGMLSLHADAPDFFNAEHREIVASLASQLAIAIQQMQLSNQIRQREEQYRLLAENMADVVWVLDASTGRFTYVSPSVEQLRGFTPGEILTQTLPETLTPASLQMITDELPARIAALVAGDPAAISQTHEVEQPCKDGSTVWTEVVTTLLQDTNGAIRVLGVTRNIAERRRSEAELREREEWIRLSMEASGLGKWRYDIAKGILRFDEQACEHYGFENNIVMVDEVLSRIHKDDGERFKREMASTLDPIQQTKTAMEYRVVHPDGSIHWISALSNIYFEGQGDARRAVYGFGTSQDITEQKHAEQALQESEQRLRLFVEHAPAAIAMLDRDMRYVLVSKRWLSDYRLEETDVIGRSHYEIFPDLPEQWKVIHQRCLAGSIETNEADSFPRADGTVDWLRWEICPWRTNQGDIGGILILSELITDRIQAEIALHDSQERYRLVVENQTDLICRYKADYRLTFVNLAYANLYSKQPEELIGISFLDLMPEAERAAAIDYVQSLSPTTPLLTGEHFSLLPDGSTRWIQWTDKALFDEHGNITEYQGVGRDITERKLAEESLRKSEERQRAMLSAMPDIMFRYRTDGTFVEYHAPDTDLLAVSPPDFLGKKVRDVLPSDLAERLMARIQQVVTTKELVQMEYQLAVQSGVREFESRLVSVGEDEVLAIVRDVTERKLAERELRSLYNATSYLFKADSLLALGRQIVAAVVREFDRADCGVMLLDQSKNNILRLARTGQSDIHPDVPLSLSGKGLVPLAMRTGEVVHAPDVTQNRDYISNESTTQSELVIPLKTANGVIGVLDMQHIQKDAFGERDRRILTAYAERAAPAIEIMRLYEELNRHASDLEWRVAQRTVELNYAKERAEAILNHSADGIILLSSEMNIEQANFAFNEIFSVPEDAYFQQPFTALLHENERERISSLIRTGSTDKKGQRYETHAVRMDGSVFDAEIGIGFLKNNGYVCIIRDITERKRAERALAEERNLLRTLIDSLPDYIYVKDKQHRTLLSNLARTRSFGLQSPDETIGKDDYAFVPAEMAAKFIADEDQLFQTLKPIIEQEERTIGPNGDVIWAATTKIPLHNLQGELIGLVGVTRDISDQKAREQQLRFDAGIQASISDAVIVTDLEFRIQSWNKAAETIYGWAADEVVGKKVAQILRTRYVSDIDREQVRQTLFDEGQVQDDYIQQRKDGTELYIRSSSTLFKDENGVPIGVVGVNQDITERKKAEQTLRESETRFRSLFASAPIATVITNQAGEITLINEQAKLIFGYATEELIGQPVEILIPASIGIQHPNMRASYISEPRVRQMGPLKELKAIRKDGSEFPVEIELSFVQTQDGVLVMSFVIDITERKKAEQSLRESEMRFGLLVNGVRDYAIYLIDTKGNIITWNQGAERIKGYSAEEIIGDNMARFYTPEDVARGEPERILKIAETEGHFSTEGLRVRKDGSLFWAEVAATALKDSTGRLFGYAKVTHDLTERRKAEEILRLSEERYRLLAENITDVISRVSPDWTYLDVSSSSQAVLGYKPQEMIGKIGSEFIHPDDMANVLQKRTEILKRRLEIPLTYRFRHRDGHYLWLEVTRKFIIDPETDTIKEYVTSARDITVRKRAEEALKNALEKEKELGELKSRFVSMASHEFRTPLATILATSETLSAYRHKLSENQIKEKLSKINDQVTYLKAIIEDTLQVARLQNPKAKYEPTNLDLDAVCRSVIDEFSSRPDVTQRFVYTCDAVLHEVFLDRKLIRQMVSNLVSNAVKYSAPNTVITISLEHNKDIITLKVQDHGIGIPEADLKHLFEPFHRATNVGTIPGTGLGLVIAKESAELHGGFMMVDSKVGEGTTFTVVIPFAGIGGK